MKVKHFIGGYDKNLSYLLWCDKSKYAAIIDPAVEINPILEYINQKKLILDKILITHSHHDHIKYLPDFINEFNFLKIYISHKTSNEFNCLSLTHNQIINIGTYMLIALETPGHYYDSFCFWNEINNMIFTGDTMFIGRTGRTVSKNSNIEDLYNSIYQILLKLPQKTMIYPGHHYGYKIFETIKNNKISSNFFNCNNINEFTSVMDNYEKNRKNE